MMKLVRILQVHTYTFKERNKDNNKKKSIGRNGERASKRKREKDKIDGEKERELNREQFGRWRESKPIFKKIQTEIDAIASSLNFISILISELE